MTDTDPEILFSELAEDLSSSSTPKLRAPDEDHDLTLREAISKVLTKTTLPLSLGDRPLNPKVPDDLFGHVLSMRAEQLHTLAIVAALADHLGMDVSAVLAKSQNIIGGQP